jgi:type IV secretion system protein VirB6
VTPLFQSFYQLLDNALTDGVNSVIASGLAYAAQPLRYLLAIYIGIIGFLALTGQAEEPFRVLVVRVVRASFVVYILTASVYNQYVHQFFMNGLPNSFARAINHTNGAGASARQFDLIWSATMHQTAAVLQQATGLTNIGTRILSYIAQGLIGVALGISFIVWEMARALLGVVIAIGPFIIAGYLFDATRPIVERWIGKLVSLIILQLTVSILLQFLLKGQNQYMLAVQNSINGDGLDQRVMTLLQIAVFFLMCAFLMVMLPGVAYSIGSGIAFSTSGLVGAVTRAPGRVLTAVRGRS